MSEQIVAFQGEVLLLNWGDTSTRGRTVTFQLADEGEEHPFKHHPIGRKTGRRFMAVLVEIGDDERPVEKTPAQMAYLLCKDTMFQHFLDERSFVEVCSEATARHHILSACGITSRSSLDTDTRARAHWDALIYQPWLRHKATTGKIL